MLVSEFYKDIYEVAFVKLESYYNQLDVTAFFDSMPQRDNIQALMDWSINISPIYGSLGQIQAETETLLNRLKMIAIDKDDLPKDEKIKRAVIGSSTMFTQYLDGKFSTVSRLREKCKEDRRSIERIIDVVRTIISEHKVARQMGEIQG